MFMTPCTLKFCPRINGYGVTDALLISAKSCEIAYKCKQEYIKRGECLTVL